MNERGELGLRIEQTQSARVGQIRILRAQNWNFALDGRTFCEINRGGVCRVYLRRVARICEKGDVAGSGFIESGGAGNLKITGAVIESRGGQVCEFRKFHARSLSQR